MTIASTTTYACAPCEVTWALADGINCWSCGIPATVGAFTDTTRPPRTAAPTVSESQVIGRADILRAHEMGLPDPRACRTHAPAGPER